jgi:hypothetical protein
MVMCVFTRLSFKHPVCRSIGWKFPEAPDGYDILICVKSHPILNDEAHRLEPEKKEVEQWHCGDWLQV